jgi:nucleoside 2-deoxyribosyltransferase
MSTHIKNEVVQELSSAPDRYVSCYTTAKRIHSDKILSWRSAWPKIYFTARWPVVRNISTEQMRPASHWLRDNVDDIVRSETVLAYAEPDDQLSGTIFELGIAWAHGKDIWLVGENPLYKEWRMAPRIRNAHNLEQALKEITRRADYHV